VIKAKRSEAGGRACLACIWGASLR
jgi:hypothetical protein